LAPDFDILKRVRFPPIKTLDTSATPGSGAKRPQPKHLAAADIGRLSALLAAADDSSCSPPAASHRQAPSNSKAAEERGFERGKLAGEKLGRAAAFRELLSGVERAQGVLSGTIADLAAIAQHLSIETFDLATAPPLPEQREVPAAAQPRTIEKAVPVEGSIELSAAAEEFLKTAVKFAPVRLTWGQLGVLCQRKAQGGSFNTARRQLLDRGLVCEVRSSLVEVLAAGYAYLGESRPLVATTPAALIGVMIEALPRPANDILAALAKSKSPVQLEQLGLTLGRATHGGSWNTAMAILRNNALIQETAGGYAVAELECQ
jgi:hypothetical protein